MNNISGFQTFDKNLSGVITISDGGGTIISNGEIDCKTLYVNGVQVVGSTSGSATVNVGTTTTLPAGSNATVTNVGTSTNAVLNFGIPQGIQGQQGVQGSKGDTGQGFTYLGNFNAYYQYFPYDVVFYNGSSYVCTVQSYGNYPSNTAYWSLIAKQGDTGSTGSQGPQGPKGEKGDDGPRGPKGEDGTSVDVAALAVSVASAIGIAALQLEISAVQTEVSALSATVAIAEENIAVLQTKTQNQTAGFETTTFTGDVHISNGISNKITLHKQGDIECTNLETSGGLTANGTIQTDGGITSNDNVIINNGSFTLNNTTNLSNVNPMFQVDMNGNVNMQGDLNIKQGLVTVGSIENRTGILTCNGAILNQALQVTGSSDLNDVSATNVRIPGNGVLQTNKITSSNQLIKILTIGEALGMVNIYGTVNIPGLVTNAFNIQDGFMNQFN